eukprot:Opistho-2@10241
MAVGRGVLRRFAVVLIVTVAFILLTKHVRSPQYNSAPEANPSADAYKHDVAAKRDESRGAHEAELSHVEPPKNCVNGGVDVEGAAGVDPMRIAPLSAVPVRARHFEGSNILSRLRIAVADSLNDDSRERCFAVTAASLFPFAFEYIEGKDDGSHVSE